MLLNIQNAYIKANEKNWDKVYWAIDVHNTIFKGRYTNKQTLVFYPNAKEVLQNLYKNNKNCLILYTSSYQDEIRRILQHLNKNKIRFSHVNQNPDCKNTEYADFSKKFYFNILIDDKAGFNAETDWCAIKSILQSIGEWK